jgi:hypothetical protein
MSENHEQPIDATYICDFGTVSLDVPFAQQPSLQQFLDVPTSKEGRLVSDELLQRFLAISECAIRQELDTEMRKQALRELHLGYELWKALPTGADHHDRKPEDLEESGWVDLDRTSRAKPSSSLTTSPIMLQVVKQLIRRCQEEVLHRINSELLIDKSFYILIYGKRSNLLEMMSFPQEFGVPSCRCRGRVGKYSGADGLCTESC